MASNYTTNYQLNQWEAGDQVLRTEFNQDNQKIDAALKNHDDELATHTSALAQMGNCEIVYGSYQGTGAYGQGNHSTLTFEHEPLLVAIMPETISGQSVMLGFWAVRGSSFLYTSEYYQSKVGLIWQDKALSWSGSDSSYQFNDLGTTYYYVALLKTDE